MQIHGLEGLSSAQVRDEVRAGGRFVVFSYCVSVLVLTFRRSTDIYFVRANESAAGKSIPWTLVSLVFGWWGFPFGLVFTPIAIFQNLAGGKDVTAEVLGALELEAPAAPPSMLGGVPGQPGSPFAAAGFEETPHGASGAPGAVSGWVGSPGVGDAPGPVSSAQGWVVPPPGTQRSDPVSSQATWSLALGAVSLACCAPLGWIGAVLGVLSLKRAREQGRPAPGMAVGGLVLSGLSTLMLLGLVAVGVQSARELDARRAKLLERAAGGRTGATLAKTTACLMVELALLDGLYGDKTQFTSVTCDGEVNDTPGGAELDVVRARWTDKDETLTACFARSSRWYLLSVGPDVRCPDEAPASTALPDATEAELTAEEKRLQQEAKAAQLARADAVGARGGSQYQVPLGEADFPRLELDVGAVYRAQKPSKVPPFHVAGGDWTYFDVSVRGQPEAKATVGARTGESPTAFSFGDAVLVGSDREAGAKFVEAYARAFRVEVPPPVEPQTPLEPLTFRTAVLATGVAALPGGGFGDEAGTWTATKWFPTRDGEVEVFFNYDLEGRRAELSEKDEGSREDLAELLAATLRDGPRPPRTPQNDPTLAATGPVFQAFTQVSAARLRTWLEGNRLLFLKELPRGEAVLQRELATGATTELCRVEHQVDQLEQSGPRTLIQEVLPEDEEVTASTDPTRVVLCEQGRASLIELADSSPRTELLTSSISADGRYLALGRWEDNARGKGRHRTVVLLDRQSGWETTVRSGDDSFDVVGWREERGEPVAELEKGFVFDSPEERAALDYFLVARKQAPSRRALHPAHDAEPTSPDGAWTFEVERGRALVVTEVKSGERRRLELHPEDRRFADDDAFGWVDNRTLRFDATRPALIDVRVMKVWFPLPEQDTSALRYSSDFRSVVKSNEDGTFVGRVVLPKEPRRQERR